MQDVTWPAYDLVAVTKSDSTVYSPALRQLYVGGFGDVVVQTDRGTIVTFKSVAPGSVLGPFFISKVMAATTATDIVGFE